ncbi:MAG: hypothetical protein WAV47_22245 [Blastocatellia bacterium]
MKLGAVAILDALGVKGIWKREKPEAILGKLHALRSDVTGDLSKAQQAFPKMLGTEAITRQAAFLSDSLVVGVSIEPSRAEFLGNGPPVRDGFTDLVRQDHALRDLLFTLARLLNVAAADAALHIVGRLRAESSSLTMCSCWGRRSMRPPSALLWPTARLCGSLRVQTWLTSSLARYTRTCHSLTHWRLSTPFR